MANYLKRFIPNYSSQAHPLRELTKKDKPFEWSEQCENSFQAITTALTETSCVTYFDEKKKPSFLVTPVQWAYHRSCFKKQKEKHGTKVTAYTSRSLP